ncbi:MAG: carboxylating nicotinate-nucleotide diphosphorylase [Proteobacteria bacterium]|nr:carboxylating nicotinate-nucleotide diphosphorylase [Pseudomonadota bacterium]
MHISSVQHLIDLAISEDLGPGDITTDNIVAEGQMGKGEIVAKQSLMLAGLDVVEAVFKTLDDSVACLFHYKDGDTVKKGDTVFTVSGSLRTLLKGERTALNFLQRMSGIATHVRSYVDHMSHAKVKLTDTRKTTPGWRILEKYAVRVGGAYNHRMALYDGVLIKDNHIAVGGGILAAVSKVKCHVSHLVKIEVEVSTMDEVREALSAGVDVIMLDNMDLDQIRDAVKLINGKVLVEVSGNVTKESLKSLAATGVDIISSGALTHQAVSVDLSMRITTA